MDDKITGRIIKIVDEYTVIVNIGKENGISFGDYLKVKSEGIEIKDPETGDILGKYGETKARLKVKDVYDKFSICKNSETIKKEVPIPNSNWLENAITANSKANYKRPTETKTYLRKLNVNSSEIEEIAIDSVIKIGDEVEII